MRRSGTATIIVEDLKKIGLDAQFQPIEFNALVTAIQRNYDYEALLLGTTGGNPPDPVKAPARADELPRFALSPVRARIHLGWAPWTTVADGLRQLA